jgi:hypothetical protein
MEKVSGVPLPYNKSIVREILLFMKVSYMLWELWKKICIGCVLHHIKQRL